jgi:hypothetical protein
MTGPRTEADVQRIFDNPDLFGSDGYLHALQADHAHFLRGPHADAVLDFDHAMLNRVQRVERAWWLAELRRTVCGAPGRPAWWTKAAETPHSWGYWFLYGLAAAFVMSLCWAIAAAIWAYL